jgi:hypothetical protein
MSPCFDLMQERKAFQPIRVKFICIQQDLWSKRVLEAGSSVGVFIYLEENTLSKAIKKLDNILVESDLRKGLLEFFELKL